jgi:hypothetical protein
MCRHHGHGFGRGFLGRQRLSREEWLQRLEAYQRDLEQEIADVADLVRRLQEERPEATATATV